MSKEQKELIALVFIICAIVVAACVMLIIKPKLREVGEKKKNYAEVSADLAKERKLSRQLLELTERKERLEASIAESEAGLLGGITVGDLSRIVNTIIETEFRDLKISYLGDRVEVLPGKRYNELTNELMLKDCDFCEVVRFIGALETSNSGIRVTNIGIASADARAGETGEVTAGLEVRMVGKYDGEGVGPDWRPAEAFSYDPVKQRNPFGPVGSQLLDPERAFKDTAYNLKVTMNTGDSLWIKDITQEEGGARECMLKRSMPVFEPAKVWLVRIHEDYFIVRREDGRMFKLYIRQGIEVRGGKRYERGTIKRIDKLE